MDNFYINIGKRIKRLRTVEGLSREKFGDLVGISAKFLYSLEAGKKGMSARTLYNIAQALSVSTDFLIQGESDD